MEIRTLRYAPAGMTSYNWHRTHERQREDTPHMDYELSEAHKLIRDTTRWGEWVKLAQIEAQ